MEQQELIDQGVSDIASSLGIAGDTAAPEVPETEQVAAVSAPEGGGAPDAAATPVDEGAAPVVEMKAAPKAWPKDMHEHWGKLDPAVQGYLETREQQMLEGLNAYKEYHTLGKSLNDVLGPYRPMIQAAGIDDAKAVASLLNAHYRLTQGSPDDRRAAYEQLGRDLGFVQNPQQAQMPPEVQRLMREQQQIKAALQQQEHRRVEETRKSISSQIDAFAKDKPYFDEVANETAAFINAGLSLEDAYERAVYANPATREKELARLQKEREAKAKEKAAAEVAAAKRGTAANVRGQDTGKTPTGSKGKFLDTDSMRADLREIASRSTH